MQSTSDFIRKFIEVAKSDVGYKEGKNNANKFAADVSAPNHAPYCAIGIMSAAHRAGADLHKIFNTPWYVAGIYSQARTKGWLTNSPQDGDLVVEDFGHAKRTGEHIEIAVPSKGARHTIGYNTSAGSGSQANGDGVYARVRKADDIVAYISLRKVLASASIGLANDNPRGPIIRNGDRGQVVSDIQARLQAKGISIVADGVYGVRTEAAVRTVQRAYRLTVDGIVGPVTFSALRADDAPRRAKVRKGDRGGDVKELQTLLGVGADGVAGPKTDAAIRAAQARYGLAVDGVAGADTWSALFGMRIAC